jgi:hypothetical protein
MVHDFGTVALINDLTETTTQTRQLLLDSVVGGLVLSMFSGTRQIFLATILTSRARLNLA